MTRQGRQDLIAIACAFAGAAAVRGLVPPVEGIPAVAMSIAGAALGIVLARAVFKVLNDQEARTALAQSKADKGRNDAEFAAALRAHSDGDETK